MDQQRISLKIFCQSKGFNAVSKVRVNANGYKYVTLANTKTSDVENLYLGVRYSELVETGDVLPINDLWVNETVNAQNETRFKLTNSSGEMSAEKAADYQTF